MEVAQEVPIEPEKDKDPAFDTFLSAAPLMPYFSDEELAKGLDRRWQRQAASLLQRKRPGWTSNSAE